VTWRRLADILARRPEHVDHDARWLAWHVPELGELRWAECRDRVASRAKAAGVSVRWFRKNDLGRRVWLLAAACLDGVPFLVFQNGGREGDDEMASWVVDGARYAEAIYRLTGRSRPRVPAVCDLSWRYPDLGCFFGHDLDDPASRCNMDLIL